MSTPSNDAIQAAAQRLIGAVEHLTPVAPVRELIGATDVASAYAVQELVIAHQLRRGERIVGRKIGLTSEAVQKQLGVDQPDFGVLFAGKEYAEGATVPSDTLLQPKVEAEVAFVLSEDLDDDTITAERAGKAVAYAVAALEIVDSRIADWDITFGDTVADNASFGAFVLGTERKTLDDYRPVDSDMTMSVDGEVVSTGTGASCLGDPLEALAWLARTARELGSPLRKGQIILSGALGPMAPVAPGSEVRASISGLGEVTVRFSARDSADTTDTH